jgi:WhiB family transcriptional regulator, redox-sensing transcriptional regulator
MNGGAVMNEHEFYDGMAWDLDVLQEVSSEVLFHRVSRDGACMWVRTIGAEPQWTGDDAADRELAAPICAGCSVQRECMELEFRSAGYATAGVWGPLGEQDRRAVYLAWLARRAGDQQ